MALRLHLPGLIAIRRFSLTARFLAFAGFSSSDDSSPVPSAAVSSDAASAAVSNFPSSAASSDCTVGACDASADPALDRLDPVLPLSPGRIERHGFEYYRHGTLSLYAALETATGRVHGKTAARHTSQDFVAFLEEVIAHCPAGQQIHIILDNLSAHKTRLVDDFLEKHSRVHFHFTPTYSSWLNQVELWFGKIERDLIARGVFTSVNDLARKIRRYVKAYSANAKPIQWKYSDPTRRIRSNELTATGC